MRKKSTYIAIIIGLLVFFLIMFFAFGYSSLKRKDYTTTLLVGDNTIWTYKNKRWSHITSFSAIQKLNWQSYHVYLNNQEFGKYYLWHDDKWYAFDNKKNAVLLEGTLFAYSANHDMSVASFEEENIIDNSLVSKVLSDNGLDPNSQFTSSSQISLDFDNDGEVETFYVLSNAFASDFEVEKVFSIVFMQKGENTYMIYKDISNHYTFKECKPFFNTILDVDNDSTYEFVLSCGRYSLLEQIDMLYQFKDNEFKILISNQ